MDIVIGDRTYTTGRLDAFKQFHVARRLAPVLASMGTAAFATQGKSDDEGLQELVKSAIDVIARMDEEDVNYVLQACLGVAKVKVADGWARLMDSSGKRLMYDDLSMDGMMRITITTIRENLGDFLPMLNAVSG